MKPGGLCPTEPATRTGNRHRCLKGAFIIRNPDGALFTVSDTKGGDLIQRTQVD